MRRELRRYFAGLRDDFQTRVVILRGNGRGFCAGVDIRAEGGASRPTTARDKAGDQSSPENEVSRVLREQRELVDVFRQMRQAPQPIIALVHGAAAGSGFALALAADVRLATPQAKMNVAMFKMGTTGGDMGISYFLPRMCGVSVASELMLTGRFIGGERALRTNLVSELYDTREEMEAGARSLAAEMLAGDDNGLRLTKECLSTSVDAPSFESAVAMEDRQQALMVIGGGWKARTGAFSASAKAQAQAKL
eukprot:CAMPEP_0204605790 /NCGR_PEP_ID=MMETSP0661-20131031/58694_1 /ASSEMBLY_ACC=CAM_ASM_000606 /TAXON_ID=109239 /ORGANISM="Alexandrium margalefi, Strain AMGDE01CS-322" /LENGTH=250 /DNA_ID=CAMNT_0051617057 /DNA_START=133 /DNA_END=885 /DNA_ORIENTATION=+